MDGNVTRDNAYENHRKWYLANKHNVDEYGVIVGSEDEASRFVVEMRQGICNDFRKLDWRFEYLTDSEIQSAYRQAKIYCECAVKKFNDAQVIEWALGDWKPVI